MAPRTRRQAAEAETESRDAIGCQVFQIMRGRAAAKRRCAYCPVNSLNLKITGAVYLLSGVLSRVLFKRGVRACGHVS